MASILAARLRGRNTTISPCPEISCEAPLRLTAVAAPLLAPLPRALPLPAPRPVTSGLIHAVMVPEPVSALTEPDTRVKQILPPLDSTSIGPETYITRIPPPPVDRKSTRLNSSHRTQ